jgi:fumarate reductase flavoprotein subunit
MWKDVGIIRSEDGLTRARETLAQMHVQLMTTGVADGDRAFNAQWHDWLNLRNLISVSRVITEAAIARDNSRGAHFREDFPAAGDLESSTFTTVRLTDGNVQISKEAVHFGRVRPGQTILTEEKEEAAAPPVVAT